MNNLHISQHPFLSPPRQISERRKLTVLSFKRHNNEDDVISHSRRGLILSPLLFTGAAFLHSFIAKAEEVALPPPSTPQPMEKEAQVEEEVASAARIYDVTVIGEPEAVGKEKGRVWEKVMNARVVYLGEAELVPTKDDKELELEIVDLGKRCITSERIVSVALEAFPCDLQDVVDQFLDGSINEEML